MPSAPRFGLPRFLPIVMLLIPVAALAQTESSPKKKMTDAKSTATQTAPAADKKPAAQTAPIEPGAQTVSGRVIIVHPEKKAVVIRGASTDFQVYIGPQTKVIRDGQIADLMKIKVNDLVNSCHFNAKHVVSNIDLTSAERSLSRPAPSKP